MSEKTFLFGHLKNPDRLIMTAYTTILSVKAIIQTGSVVPMTVTSRQYFLPIRSLSRPKIGQLRNAKQPFAVSIIPTAK